MVDVHQALDTIEQFVKGAYGGTAYERIDGGTHAAQRHAAVQRFNQADSSAWYASCLPDRIAYAGRPTHLP